MTQVKEYIDRIVNGLNLPEENLSLIREEIEGHVDDLIRARAGERNRPEAIAAEAIHAMGDPHELREAYRAAYFQQHAARLAVRFLGLGLFLTLLMISGFMAGGAARFLNLHALLLVPVGATILLLGTYPFKTVFRALAAPFRFSVDARKTQWRMVERVFHTWACFMWGCGLFAAVLGALLTCHGTACSVQFGPALSLAILGLSYGTLLGGMLWVFAQNLPCDEEIHPCKRSHGLRAFLSIVFFAGIFLFTWQRFHSISQLFQVLISLPALIFLTTGVFALTVASCGFKDSFKLMRSILQPRKRTDSMQTEIHSLGIYFGIVGLIGFLVSGVFMLSTLSDPADMLQGTVTALHPLLYGIVCGLFCRVIAGSCLPQKEIPQSEMPAYAANLHR
ncbi:MAG: hypothetical protein KJ645_10410 [Planctomycetes bacterium]|nr:hypothetical protein [Planctomycetota bacterium]